MNKREIRELLTDLHVVKPCGVNWNDMSGDEKIRLCSQCNLKVHNLSGMTEKEAAIVLKRRNSERTCIYFARREDGSVIVDNCPQQLKMARNRVFGIVASVLMCLAYGIYLSSPGTTALSTLAVPAGGGLIMQPSVIGHGGLVPAIVDPTFGQANEVVMLADFGYDAARDISRSITLISFLIVFFIPMSKEKRESKRRVLVELFALGSVPVLVHLAGTFVVNNFGGLGGGL